jgi:hypothetical protein
MSITGDLAEERCERAFERERTAFREELARYRKVAEAALAYRWAQMDYRLKGLRGSRAAALDAALAAVGMKVAE